MSKKENVSELAVNVATLLWLGSRANTNFGPEDKDLDSEIAKGMSEIDANRKVKKIVKMDTSRLHKLVNNKECK